MRKLIVGNWKMYVDSLAGSKKLLKGIDRSFPRGVTADVVLCPAVPFSVALRDGYKGKRIQFGAQDTFWEQEGAFTGKVSPTALQKSGIEYVIIGHAEARAFGDNNEIVARKVSAALKAGLRPIVCIGEMERDQDGGHFAHLTKDVTESLQRVEPTLSSRITIAYEPVWAIGAPQAPDPRIAEEAIVFIRKTLASLWGREKALKVRIIYGGAVDQLSAPKFAEHRGIQGLLVGRASVDAQEFTTIIKAFTS